MLVQSETTDTVPALPAFAEQLSPAAQKALRGLEPPVLNSIAAIDTSAQAYLRRQPEEVQARLRCLPTAASGCLLVGFL